MPPLKDLPAEALGEMAAQMFVPLDVVGRISTCSRCGTETSGIRSALRC